MVPKDKELLLKDLSARLPYGVKVLCMRDLTHIWYNLDRVDIRVNEVYVTTPESHSYADKYVEIESVRPYLFPLSSMTKEQESYLHFNTKFRLDRFGDLVVKIDEDDNYMYTDSSDYTSLINWCYENHFDIHGLIPKGLANDATGLNIY